MTIKETAGKILLVLYSLQIENPIKLKNDLILIKTIDRPVIEGNDGVAGWLHKITDDDTRLYNGLQYLFDKHLIAKSNNKNAMGAYLIRGLYVTDLGLDIIQGVEQGEESQKKLKSLFNFNFTISPKIQVDSLVKAEVGNIVGVGGAIGGKLSL